MRLLVHIPKKYRSRTYDIAVCQLFKGQEVGRVTWRLAPRKKKKGFEIYFDKASGYRWHLLTEENKIVADSGEGYKTREECERNIALVKRLCAASNQL